MIKIARSKEEILKLLKLCSKSAFGCKISALIKAYGIDEKFANFWMDSEEEAVYCLIDGIMIISGTISDAEEAKTFIKAVGAKETMSAIRNSEVIGFTEIETGDVLRRDIISENTNTNIKKSEEINIRDIAFLLEESEMIFDFEAFYLDLSHRLRHGTAIVETEYVRVNDKDSELIGCAVASGVIESSAIISAIAVRKEYRRQGYGEKLVKRIENQLDGKTSYIFKEKGKNEEFYKHLKYFKTDTWVRCSVD